jgi:hypothetical protein
MGLQSPAGQPHPFSVEILRMVREYDASRPRSMQRYLGPSEIGSPCARQLAMKLAHTPEVNQVADPWFPIVGSAVHEWLARMAEWYNDVYLGRANNPRFIVENRVQVKAKEGGYDTSGSTDMYDVDYQRVVDWKIVGVTTMRKVEKGDTPIEKAGPQYTIQTMTYGKGWEQAGYPVKSVMIAFLPRSNFLNKMKLVEMPYDRAVADAAQDRVAAIDRLRGQLQPHQFPAGDCTIWCPFYVPGVPLGPGSCPGHGKVADE